MSTDPSPPWKMTATTKLELKYLAHLIEVMKKKTPNTDRDQDYAEPQVSNGHVKGSGSEATPSYHPDPARVGFQ